MGLEVLAADVVSGKGLKAKLSIFPASETVVDVGALKGKARQDIWFSVGVRRHKIGGETRGDRPLWASRVLRAASYS